MRSIFAKCGTELRLVFNSGSVMETGEFHAKGLASATRAKFDCSEAHGRCLSHVRTSAASGQLQPRPRARKTPSMPDVFTTPKRSAVMALIRSTGNRATELRMITLLRTHRITGWRRGSRLPGSPDFVFRAARLAMFVDGCFWHGCPRHGRVPDSRREYWLPKLTRNKARDRAVTRALHAAGWRVIRVWECALSVKRQPSTLRRIARALATPMPGQTRSRQSK
jgi:DNA mismatch endonuclease (patch repair protein)